MHRDSRVSINIIEYFCFLLQNWYAETMGAEIWLGAKFSMDISRLRRLTRRNHKKLVWLWSERSGQNSSRSVGRAWAWSQMRGPVNGGIDLQEEVVRTIFVVRQPGVSAENTLTWYGDQVVVAAGGWWCRMALMLEKLKLETNYIFYPWLVVVTLWMKYDQCHGWDTSRSCWKLCHGRSKMDKVKCDSLRICFSCIKLTP